MSSETSILLHDILLQNKLTVATAESCTAGKVASLIASTAGSSSYFVGSVVAYDARIKTQLLGVPAQVIDDKGVVSREVAEQMARGVAQLMNVQCAIATTGVAGPGDQGEVKQGTVWMAALCNGHVVSSVCHFEGDRARVMEQAAETAARLLINLIKTKI